jgi:FKBP-type peptidyl-prolyl cis-trans isomerase 2
MEAKEGSKVKIEYTGTFDDGTVFDTSEGKKPLEFTVGAKQVIRGFDDAVKGMKQGEEKEITIPPAEGYGPVREQLVQKVPRQAFGDKEIKTGMVVGLQSKEGHKLAAVIKEIGDEQVTLDLNHPLAGKTLHFKIKLVEVSE